MFVKSMVMHGQPGLTLKNSRKREKSIPLFFEEWREREKITLVVADQQIKSVHWFQATDVVLIFSPLIILAFA